MAEALEVLETGEVEVLGLLPYSSNYVFLARVETKEDQALAVYKPRRGERPLWDFPSGTLAAREVAAFEVSEAAGWHLVPPTVLRDDAPLGAGSLQLYIEHDPERHYFALIEERPDDLLGFAVFDVVINNADRKAGHVVEDERGGVWGVDHGLSFNAEPKLRTVIWAFADLPLDAPTLAALSRLESSLAEGAALHRRLAGLLSPRETEATRARAAGLIAEGRLPCPGADYHLPWPLV